MGCLSSYQEPPMTCQQEKTELIPSLKHQAPEWLGLDPEAALKMLLPESGEADWRAKPDENGYVSLRSILKMLETYAETGAVRWPSRDEDSRFVEGTMRAKRHRVGCLAFRPDPGLAPARHGKNRHSQIQNGLGTRPFQVRYCTAGSRRRQVVMSTCFPLTRYPTATVKQS